MADHEHVYAEVDGSPLTLRVFAARGARRLRTAVLMLHGGGWRFGDRSALEPAATRLAEHGLTCVPVQYRLLTGAAWPAPLEDVRAAVRWVRAHVDELEVEPDRIVLYGESSGGHLALLAAATAAAPEHAGAEIAAVVSFYAPTEFRAGPVGPPMSLDGEVEPTLGAYHLLERDADEADARAVSPLAAVSAACPPTLLFHGGADTIIDPGMSERLYAALTAAGVPCDLHLFSGQIHHFDDAPSFSAIVDATIAQFLDRTVADPEGYGREQREHNHFLQLVLAQPEATTP
jgi:acetyl esterase/lipase